MLENLLYQDRVKEELRKEFHAGIIQPCQLFCGPPLCGKMTTALEIARALCCTREKAADWGCDCPQCLQHRSLESPNIVLLGLRNFAEEIIASARLYSQSPKSTSKKRIFQRNLKKFTRRFDSFLWEDNKSGYTKAVKHLSEIHDAELNQQDYISNLQELIKNLLALLPANGVSINMLRRMIHWTHTVDRRMAKIVIIEGFDQLGDSCFNAVLKILEEPPDKTYFILCCEHPESIPLTLRSRLASIWFRGRSKKEEGEILKKVYGIREVYTSIQDFFDRQNGKMSQSKKCKILFRLIEKNDIQAQIELIRITGGDRRELCHIISGCLEELRTYIRQVATGEWGKLGNSTISHYSIYSTQRRLEEMQFRAREYNVPVASVLEIGYI